MRYIINDQVVLLRAPEGPLAPYIVSFSKCVIEQGYALSSLRQRIRIAVGLVAREEVDPIAQRLISALCSVPAISSAAAADL